MKTCASQWVVPELRVIKPRVLVVFGEDACESVFKGAVPFEHLKVVKGSEKRVAIMAWSPGYVLRRSDLLPSYISALGAAIKQALEDTE